MVCLVLWRGQYRGFCVALIEILVLLYCTFGLDSSVGVACVVGLRWSVISFGVAWSVGLRWPGF